MCSNQFKITVNSNTPSNQALKNFQKKLSQFQKNSEIKEGNHLFNRASKIRRFAPLTHSADE